MMQNLIWTYIYSIKPWLLLNTWFYILIDLLHEKPYAAVVRE